MTVLRKMRTDEAVLRKARMLIGGRWVDSASGIGAWSSEGCSAAVLMPE